MFQIIFKIPLNSVWDALPDLPIFGYGTMLFLAFVCGLTLARRLSRREGIPKGTFEELTIWMFIAAILGARFTYFLQYREQFHTFGQFFAIWDGGLIFYGALFGAAVGYVLCFRFVLRQRGVSNWRTLDVLACCLALGLCIGRLGCLLNGCCYGNVACVGCPAVHFPLPTEPRKDMTHRGYQTAAGFTLIYPHTTTPALVEYVAPGAAADVLKPGDTIIRVSVEGKPVDIKTAAALEGIFAAWPRGENRLEMTVDRGGKEIELAAFVPRGIGLHPTQVYESISMGLLAFVLLSYYPFKKRDGTLLPLWMVAYAVHRFLNEMLRTDTAPVAFGLTLSQNISIVILLLALVLWLAVPREPREPDPAASTPSISVP